MKQPPLPVKKSIWQTAWKVLQPVFISVTTFCSIACLKFALSIYTFMVTKDIQDKNRDQDIAQFRVDIGLNTKSNNRQDGEINILVGLLPDKQKKLFEPKTR